MTGNNRELSKNNRQPIKEVRIVSESVVDRYGNIIGDNPMDFPSITNKAKQLIAYLETGKEHVVVDQTDKKSCMAENNTKNVNHGGV